MPMTLLHLLLAKIKQQHKMDNYNGISSKEGICKMGEDEGIDMQDANTHKLKRTQ